MTASRRSWLFVPGSRPERFDKARASGADQVILDLEDAVEAESKAEARENVAQWLASGRQAWVRINGVDTEWWEEDVAALGACAPALLGVVVPKADVDAVGEVAGHVGRSTAILALVETAGGVLDAVEVARHPVVTGLAFGSVDYALDLSTDDPGALDHARHALVVAARACGSTDVVDGVSLGLADVDAVRGDASRARSLGFTGKLCIHPLHVPAVHAGLAPTDDELVWASRVLAAAQHLPPGHAGAFQVDGRMVDRPLLLRAQRLVAEGAR